MATPLLVLIILAIVIIASIITSVVTYVILSGRNKRIRLAEQYRQLGITEQYLKIQDEIERIIRYKDIKLTTASPVKMSNPEDGQNAGNYERRACEKYSGSIAGFEKRSESVEFQRSRRERRV